MRRRRLTSWARRGEVLLVGVGSMLVQLALIHGGLHPWSLAVAAATVGWYVGYLRGQRRAYRDARRWRLEEELRGLQAVLAVAPDALPDELRDAQQLWQLEAIALRTTIEELR